MDEQSRLGAPAAGLLRRLAALVYDGLLLLAILFVGTLAILPLTGGEGITPAAPGLGAYLAYRGYLALRAFFRSPFIRFTAFALPERAVEWIGNRSADSSRKRNPRLPESRGGDHLANLRKTFRTFAERKFREGFDAIVLGHCHDLDGEEFIADRRKGRYLNVGFPRAHHSYVEFTEAGGLVRKPLKRFDH